MNSTVDKYKFSFKKRFSMSLKFESFLHFNETTTVAKFVQKLVGLLWYQVRIFISYYHQSQIHISSKTSYILIPRGKKQSSQE